MGTTPLPDPDVFIEADHDQYATELALKHKLLAEDHGYCFGALPGTEQAQWEVVDKVLRSLVRTDPGRFKVLQDGGYVLWQNTQRGQTQRFIPGHSETLPGGLTPLDWVGREVQEDLLILDPNGILVAGQLCFPSGWALHEKLGKNFMDIHQPLPGALAPMLMAADKLMGHIPAGKPLQRNNWGLRVTEQLDLSSRHSDHYRNLLREKASQIATHDAGRHLYLRVEHQTLSRLPLSDHILFTIHTYQSKLSQEIDTSEKARQFLTFLQSVPSPVLDYKLVTPLLPALVPYLQSQIYSLSGQ